MITSAPETGLTRPSGPGLLKFAAFALHDAEWNNGSAAKSSKIEGANQ